LLDALRVDDNAVSQAPITHEILGPFAIIARWDVVDDKMIAPQGHHAVAGDLSHLAPVRDRYQDASAMP
jgi:hypothetical protein